MKVSFHTWLPGLKKGSLTTNTTLSNKRQESLALMVCFEDEEARNEQLRKDILAEQEPGKS